MHIQSGKSRLIHGEWKHHGKLIPHWQCHLELWIIGIHIQTAHGYVVRYDGTILSLVQHGSSITPQIWDLLEKPVSGIFRIPIGIIL
jgi:hypothetical protein